LLKSLKTKRLGQDFLFFDSLDSTNDYCKNHLASLPDFCCVYADLQTRGKGRREKSWENKKGTSVAMSLVLKNIPPERLTGLTLIIGLAVKQAAEALTGHPSQIKWPNDVLMNHKKICGILCEAVFEGGTACTVCGIGLNILQDSGFFETAGLRYAGSLLTETGCILSPLDAAASVLNELEPLLELFLRQGFPPLRQRYKDSCANLGRESQVFYNNKTIAGTVMDISESGSLLVDCGGECIEVLSGDVSVRGLYGYV